MFYTNACSTSRGDVATNPPTNCKPVLNQW